MDRTRRPEGRRAECLEAWPAVVSDLGAPDPDAAELAVAEGIETALAFRDLHGLTCWAALSTTGLRRFQAAIRAKASPCRCRRGRCRYDRRARASGPRPSPLYGGYCAPGMWRLERRRSQGGRMSIAAYVEEACDFVPSRQQGRILEWPDARPLVAPYVFRPAAEIPPREWLYGRHYIRHFVSTTIAPGGVGKSALAITEALAMATGRPLLGVQPLKRLRVAYWNGEDPLEETERRVVAAIICSADQSPRP